MPIPVSRTAKRTQPSALRSTVSSIWPFSDRTYCRLFTAQVITLAGTGLSAVALALLAFELAGSDAGIVLGTAFSLKMGAYVGIAPIVGCT